MDNNKLRASNATRLVLIDSAANPGGMMGLGVGTHYSMEMVAQA